VNFEHEIYLISVSFEVSTSLGEVVLPRNVQSKTSHSLKAFLIKATIQKCNDKGYNDLLTKTGLCFARQ
jgi:hypothetical protein